MEHCSCRYADLIFDHDQICPIQNTQITFDPTKILREVLLFGIIIFVHHHHFA